MRARQAGSHQGRGWERFTDEVIRAVSAKPETVVFILWGSHVRRKPGRAARRHGAAPADGGGHAKPAGGAVGSPDPG